jgi:hypothetical protein
MSSWIKENTPVGVIIRDAILGFNVPWLEGHSEPDYQFAFLNVP